VQRPDEPVDHDPAAAKVLTRAALAAGACAVVTAPAYAGSQPTALPSPFFPVRATPPVQASPALTEPRFPGHLSSSQVVRVSVDASGRPIRIVDVDRIIVAAKGDYSFVIAAPAEDVRIAPGSESEPGLRSSAVVWQGFSPGRRVLAAEITLDPGLSARALPLRIEVGRTRLRLVNTTSATATAAEAPVRPVEIARALDDAKAALAAGVPIPAAVVDALGPIDNIRVTVQTPLHISGTVRFRGQAPRRFIRVVGRRPVDIAGKGALDALTLSVDVPDPVLVLNPPGARRWLELARSGRLTAGRATTRLAVNRLLTAGVALQFQEFLANPDVKGAAKSSYRYELAVRAPEAGAAKSRSGHGWLVALAVALGIVVAATAALVLWAHS
jgi:hypothetical protein